MRQAIFIALSRLNIIILDKISNIEEMISCLINAFTTYALKIIDKDRMDHAILATEQQEEITELKVLSYIFDVRNNAVEVGYWNEDHEGRLNFLGNLLANQHDWDVEDVQRYLYEVIETGPVISQED